MNRRDFLTTTAATTGYSLFISVDGLAPDPDKHSAEKLSQEMQRLGPAGKANRVV